MLIKNIFTIFIDRLGELVSHFLSAILEFIEKYKENILIVSNRFKGFEIKKAGLFSKFYVFFENVRRENVLSKADHEFPLIELKNTILTPHIVR